MTLYELTEEYQQFVRMVEDDEIPEEALWDTLEALDGEWSDKVSRLADVVKNMQALCNSLKLTIDGLTERRKKKEKEIERLQDYISRAMDALGKPKFEDAHHKITFRSSSGVVIDDEDSLKAWARDNAPEVITTKTTESLSKSALAALLASEEVPYCRIEKRRNIQIK